MVSLIVVVVVLPVVVLVVVVVVVAVLQEASVMVVTMRGRTVKTTLVKLHPPVIQVSLKNNTLSDHCIDGEER